MKIIKKLLLTIVLVVFAGILMGAGTQDSPIVGKWLADRGLSNIIFEYSDYPIIYEFFADGVFYNYTLGGYGEWQDLGGGRLRLYSDYDPIAESDGTILHYNINDFTYNNIYGWNAAVDTFSFSEADTDFYGLFLRLNGQNSELPGTWINEEGQRYEFIENGEYKRNYYGVLDYMPGSRLRYISEYGYWIDKDGYVDFYDFRNTDEILTTQRYEINGDTLTIYNNNGESETLTRLDPQSPVVGSWATDPEAVAAFF